LALIKAMLKQLAPELTEDILDKGLLLSGGLSQIDGLEAYFSQQLGIPVAVIDEPDLAALRGAVLMLDALK
jgi:rod shape-determining protein MreB